VSLNYYKQLVDRCANERLDFVIANGSPFHARLLIAKLFEVAEKQVAIVSGSLRDVSAGGVHIYGHPPVIEEAKKFLTDPDTCLNIIAQQGELHNGLKNSFVNEVVADKERNGKVRIFVPPRGELEASVPHFMVADSVCYRLETGVDAAIEVDRFQNDESMTAVANFGDHDTGRELRNYFNEIREHVRRLSGLQELYFPPGSITPQPA